MTDPLIIRIKEKVYKPVETRGARFTSSEYAPTWVLDFKNQALDRDFLQEYAKRFWNVVGDRYGPKVQIGGMETGAIALIAGIVMHAPPHIDATGFYVRKSRKKIDQANNIEGELSSDAPIILVDDILNSGSTLRKQMLILEAAGHRISAFFVCVRFRDMSAYRDITVRGVKILSMFELNDFEDVLPLHNLKSIPRKPYPENFSVAYKIVLTNKPNPYMVVPKSAPLLVGELLYVGADDGVFYCLQAESGEVVWTYRVPFGAKGKFIFSSPIVHEDKVVFGAYDGNLYCLDRFSGKRTWVFMDADWIGSSPCINTAEGIVYIGLEFGLFKRHGGVVALDIRSGEVLWKNYSIEGLVHASPAYSHKENLVVCGSNDQYLYAFDAKKGMVRWKFETQGEVKYGAVFDDHRGLVIFGSMDGGLYVLKSATGQLVHRFEARFGFYSTPALVGNLVAIGSLDKMVYAFNLETNQTEWTFETGGRIFASPLVDEDRIFIGSNDGRLYELDISSGKAVSAIQLTERIVNKIQAIRNPDGKRTLYIPTHMCEIYKMNELSA
ncbi:PQQ-binding-like beta-propeller repeat protein [Candidatus Kaiserbacteria bacterium]|nr:PQQ-binding-like beta-propeller repeat protein [Candidatus Kaiserbacteria bacterium]